MKKIFEKFYLNENNNIIFVILMICNIICCVLSYYTELKEYMGILGGVFTVFGFFGISAIKENQKEQAFESKQKELKELTIERKSWFNEIVGKEGIVLLAGDSGIGKTYLLNQLLKKFEDNNVNYYYEDNYHSFELNLDKIKKTEYIILDQFEKALTCDNIHKNIQLLKGLNEQKITLEIYINY